MREVVRTDEWWVFKLGPLLGVAYSEIALHRLHPSEAFPSVVAMLVTGVCLAAFGHVVNDVFDIEADAAAGKPNRLAHVPRPLQVLGSVVLLGGAFVPWTVWALPPIAFVFVALNAALLLAYSAPPLRLKARGAWGLLADAGYAHVVPVLVVSALFGGPAVHGWGGLAWTTGLVLWALSFGLRGILLHQIWDADVDVTAGLSTFVARAGVPTARRIIRRLLFPVEVAALLGMGTVLAVFAPEPAAVFLALAVVVYVLTERASTDRRGPRPAPEDRDGPVALVMFYAVWPPLVLGAYLAVLAPLFFLLLVLPVVLFRRAVVGEVHHAVVGARTALPLALPRRSTWVPARTARHRARQTPAPWTPGIALVLPDGLGLGGVTTWALRLAGRLNGAGRAVTLLEHPGPAPTGPPEAVPPVRRIQVDGQRPFFPIEREVREYLDAYEEALPAVLVPNYTEGAYAACALVAQKRPDDVRIVGIAHADDDYYYGLLAYYQDAVHTFVAVSDVIAARLRERLPHRAGDIVLRPYAVPCPDVLARSYAAPGQPLRLVYAGRMVEAQKRVGDFVPLVRHLLARSVDFEFTFVGDGPARARLEQRLQALGPEAARRVRFVGRVPHQEMGAVWERADLCLLVSDHEGCSISMLEAMAHGCVPVVTEVSGTDMMLSRGAAGLTVAIGDMEALADTVAALDADRGRLLQMGERARSVAASACSWDAYTDWFTALVDETWTRPPRPWPEGRPSLYPPGIVGSWPVRTAARVIATVPEVYGPARRLYHRLLDH